MQITREDINELLQEVNLDQIQHLAEQINQQAGVRILQNPTQQTLMVPVLDPVTNTKFYCGEVLMTSAVVQVESTNGWAMVMDDNPELALNVAILDGAWGADISRESIQELVVLGHRKKTCRIQKEQAEVAATKVNFDLM